MIKISYDKNRDFEQELWQGRLNWAGWKTLLMFLGFIACPPLWIVFTLPLWHTYNKVPIIKFMSYLTSHVYLMLLLQIVAITPYYKAARQNLFPYWYEWLLLVSSRQTYLLKPTGVTKAIIY